MKRSAVATNAALFIVTVLVGLLVGEIGFRFLDGYRLDRLALVPVHQNAVSSPNSFAYAKEIRLDPTFNIAWYRTQLREYDRKPKNKLPTDWVKAEDNFKVIPGNPVFLKDELRFLYNYNWLAEACKTGAHSRFLQYYKRDPGFVYAFRSPDGSDQPSYRIAPSAWPNGLDYYNNFGFRGPDINPRKSGRLIRIAFLGASTTANGWPFTYPEYVLHFLRLWAKANNLNVYFDVINAGRGGTDSHIIDNIMRYEVAPLHPDIVVYYEGANDLQAPDVLPRQFITARWSLKQNIDIAYLPLEQYSALMERIYQLFLRRGGLRPEPPKPAHTLTFDLTQQHPDLAQKDLPFSLHQQIADLRDMAATTRHVGGEFVLGSFVTLARDRMLLDPERHRIIWQNLNHGYWPMTYKEIQEAVDFQNNVFRELATTEHYPFLDVAKYFPQNPDFFADMVHFDSQEGFRLQGWIVAQLLAPYIRDAIEHGKLPKPPYTPDPKALAWAKAPPIKFNLGCLPKVTQ